MPKKTKATLRAFREGFVSAFDLGAAGGEQAIRRACKSGGFQKDARKLRRDARRIGADLREVVREADPAA